MVHTRWGLWSDEKKRKTRRERPKSAPYLRLKNIQGTTIVKIWKKKFQKNYFWNFFSKKKVFFKSQNAEKLKKRPFRLIQRFLQTENFKKNARGYPLINFKNFRKKSHSAEKNPKGGGVLLEALKNLWFSARIEPTHSGWVEDGRWTNMKDEQIVRKVDHSEWDCQLKKKKLLTVRVGLFSLREKAPTKN